MVTDVFDEVEIDLFDEVEKETDIFDETSDISQIVKAELAKIRPLKQVIERIIERPIVKTVSAPVVLPPKEVIREIIREVPKKEDKAEQNKIAELEKEIIALKERLVRFAETLPFLHGGPGVIGIPPPEGNNGKFLTVVDNKQTWGNAGISVGTFTISNNTPTYTFDPTSSTIDDLYQVVATLIRKLQGEI